MSTTVNTQFRLGGRHKWDQHLDVEVTLKSIGRNDLREYEATRILSAALERLQIVLQEEFAMATGKATL